MNYANQIRIDIKGFDLITHKEGTDDQFLQPIDWEYYDRALRELSPGAFKLWFYLLRWRGRGYYDISPVHLAEALNIKSKTSLRDYRTELITKDYLVQVSENKYAFYPGGNAAALEQILSY